jgi:hypothetical protein
MYHVFREFDKYTVYGRDIENRHEIARFIVFYKDTNTLVVDWAPDCGSTFFAGVLPKVCRNLLEIPSNEINLILVDSNEGEIMNIASFGSQQIFSLPFLIDGFKSVAFVNASFDLKYSITALANRFPSVKDLKYIGSLPYIFLKRTRSYIETDQIQIPEHNLSIIDKHFISLNAVPKNERALIIDFIMCNNLNETLNYSWLKRNYETYHNYSVKIFDVNKIKILDTNKTSMQKSWLAQERMPKEYSTSLIDVFSESTADSSYDVFITEKTWKPLLFGKPFIGFGAKGYYRQLEKIGFRLYRNIFDYSHDSISDTNDRLDAFLNNNILRLGKLPLDDVKRMVEAELPNIEYNKNLAMNFDVVLDPGLQQIEESLEYVRYCW